MSSTRAVQFPVSLVMQRRMKQNGPWSYPHWTVLGAVAGQASATQREQRRRLRLGRDGAEEGIWSGLRLALYRDAAESYWYNLVGRQPSLFVVCRPDPDGEAAPCVVTADYDEAGAYMEADDAVHAVPMPPEIHRWLEEYVMTHYRPAPPKKRRRKSWTEEDDHGSYRDSPERRRCAGERAASVVASQARGTPRPRMPP